MRFKVVALVSAMSVLAGSQAVAGQITGKVSFKGEEPEPIEIPFGPQCKKLHSDSEEKPVVDFYVVGKKNGLGDVFVYVKKGVPDKDYSAPEKPNVIDQDGCIYKPYVSSMQTGQKLLVKTSDPVLHNVHAPKLKFNKVQLQGSDPFEFTFDEPKRFLHFKCDVHPWMHSYVNVVPHPYHSVTKKNGKFKFKGLPAGDYVLEAHHRKLGKVRKKVTLESDSDTAEIDFTLEYQKGN